MFDIDSVLSILVGDLSGAFAAKPFWLTRDIAMEMPAGKVSLNIFIFDF
ncbi:hypothetical protein [Asticcacaulis sp. AND118]|nr:hypothetical protein [Asticcacaulis sp. AND118]UDF04648.1 hypothetical protein LH365_06305 [Asticcacaulis sp. AND118]